MNILIAINEKYIEPAKTMLYSLACQQTEHLVVYLLQSSIREEMLEDFRKFMRDKCHGEVKVVQIDRKLFANVPKQERLSEETYYRLVAFELLPESVERILWLDGDIIVKGNITELYNQDFEGRYAVVCAEDTMKHHARLGLSREHRYFNAGVVLYDMNALRRDFTVQDIFACIEKHRDHLDLLDQDVLNVLFDSKVKYVDDTVYNNEAFGFNILSKAKMEEIRDTARIIHYKGSLKPWNPKGANWADKYWWKYEKERGGRGAAALKYWCRHTPVKLWHYAREIYYFVKGQVSKFIKKLC
jgi:lipopolysaccharide biosynthesis glycosyltransferase